MDTHTPSNMVQCRYRVNLCSVDGFIQSKKMAVTYKYYDIRIENPPPDRFSGPSPEVFNDDDPCDFPSPNCIQVTKVISVNTMITGGERTFRFQCRI